jgi:hypothetical protein
MEGKMERQPATWNIGSMQELLEQAVLLASPHKSQLRLLPLSLETCHFNYGTFQI